jgi:hypothetical protein
MYLSGILQAYLVPSPQLETFHLRKKRIYLRFGAVVECLHGKYQAVD